MWTANEDDARQLRNRFYSDDDDATRADADKPSTDSALLIQTVTETTYPTVASRVYACKMAVATVNETEGATPSYSTYGANFYAANLGRLVPPTGTIVLARRVDGLIVFTYG